MGLAWYYMKGKKFEWIEECASNFQQFYQLLKNDLALNILDPYKHFVVCTYSCNRGLGGFLMQ